MRIRDDEEATSVWDSHAQESFPSWKGQAGPQASPFRSLQRWHGRCELELSPDSWWPGKLVSGKRVTRQWREVREGGKSGLISDGFKGRGVTSRWAEEAEREHRCSDTSKGQVGDDQSWGRRWVARGDQEAHWEEGGAGGHGALPRWLLLVWVLWSGSKGLAWTQHFKWSAFSKLRGGKKNLGHLREFYG